MFPASFILLLLSSPLWHRIAPEIHLMPRFLTCPLASILGRGDDGGFVCNTLVKMHPFHFIDALGSAFPWGGWGARGERLGAAGKRNVLVLAPSLPLSLWFSDFFSSLSTSVVLLVRPWGQFAANGGPGSLHLPPHRNSEPCFYSSSKWWVRATKGISHPGINTLISYAIRKHLSGYSVCRTF